LPLTPNPQILLLESRSLSPRRPIAANSPHRSRFPTVTRKRSPTQKTSRILADESSLFYRPPDYFHDGFEPAPAIGLLPYADSKLKPGDQVSLANRVVTLPVALTLCRQFCFRTKESHDFLNIVVINGIHNPRPRTENRHPTRYGHWLISS